MSRILQTKAVERIPKHAAQNSSGSGHRPLEAKLKHDIWHMLLLKIRKMATKQTLEIDYTKYNFHNSDENYEYKFQKGLSRETVEQISKIKT